MMRSINYIWRLFATAASFTVFGIGGALIPLTAAPWIKFRYKTAAEQQMRARKLTHKTFLLFIHFMKIMGVLSWEVQDIEKLQKPGQLIIANHPTLLDIVFLIAFIPNCDCVVKGRLRTNPAMSGFINMANFMSNDKGIELIEGAQKSLHAGNSLIIFPEGTRTKAGQTPNFQRGAAHIALRTHTPITLVHINCSPSTLSKQHKWYHIPHKKFHMAFVVDQHITKKIFDDIPASKAARQLSTELEQYFIKGINRYEQ